MGCRGRGTSVAHALAQSTRRDAGRSKFSPIRQRRVCAESVERLPQRHSPAVGPAPDPFPILVTGHRPRSLKRAPRSQR